MNAGNGTLKTTRKEKSLNFNPLKEVTVGDKLKQEIANIKRALGEEK